MTEAERVQLRGEIMGRVMALSVTGHYKTHQQLLNAIEEVAKLVDQYNRAITEWAREVA